MSGIYDVFVKISMTNGVSPVLAIISKEVLGLEVSVKSLAMQFNKLGVAAKLAIGGTLIAAGAALGGVLKTVADHGDELLDQQDKLRRVGVDMNEILKQQALYYDKIAKAVPTSTVASYLKTFNELRSVVGADKAESYAPWALKLEAIIANSTGKNAEGEGFKLMRALEMTGKTISDPEAAKVLGNTLAQNIIGSAGKLDAGTYQTMAKRGGVAWANAKPEFLSGPMSVVAADLGGETAGTAMMSAYMFMTGANTLSKQQYEVLSKAGLIDKSKVTIDKGGRINVKPGGIVGSTEYAGKDKFDLYGWVTKVMSPALAKLSEKDRAAAGGALAGGMDAAGRDANVAGLTAQERSVFDSNLAKLGRNRNVMRMFNMFSDTGFLEQIDKDLPQWRASKGVDEAYAGLTNDNSKGVKEAYNKQYESMMQSIGAPMMQMAIPVMKSIEELFRTIGSFANSNPEAIKIIGAGLAGIATALVALGATAVLAALGAFTVGGAWAVGVAGLTAALATLAGIKWETITGGFNSIIAAIQNFIAALNSFGGSTGFTGPLVGQKPGVAAPGGAGHATPAWPGLPPGKQSSLQINQTIHLDGRQIAQNVERHIIGNSAYPTRVPAGDGFTQPSYG